MVSEAFFSSSSSCFFSSTASEYSQTYMTPTWQAQTAEVAGGKASAKFTGMMQFQFGFIFCQSLCKKLKEIIKAPVLRLSKHLKERQL